MNARRWPVVLIGAGLALPLALAAAVAFNAARADWRYELAGLVDPFLGHPAPELSILIGLVVSIAVLVAAAALGLFKRMTAGSASPAVRLLAWSWVLLLIAGWGGYAAGAATVVAAGGPVEYAATLHWEFQAPLNSSADVSGTCRSVVGKPETIAAVAPDYLGLPALSLRDVVTEKAVPARFVPAEGRWGPARVASVFEPSNVPPRVKPYLMAGDQAQVPISFLEAYEYRASQVVESGLSGTASLAGTRFADPYGGGSLYWVNLTMPNDPWPATFRLTVTWTCGPG